MESRKDCIQDSYKAAMIIRICYVQELQTIRYHLPASFSPSLTLGVHAHESYCSQFVMLVKIALASCQGPLRTWVRGQDS